MGSAGRMTRSWLRRGQIPTKLMGRYSSASSLGPGLVLLPECVVSGGKGES